MIINHWGFYYFVDIFFNDMLIIGLEIKISSPQTVDKVPVFAGTFTMSTVFLV